MADLPSGVAIAINEKTPHKNIEANPIHRRPHLSSKRAKRIAAGSSVIEAREKDVKTSGSNNFIFHTCPSNTRTMRSLKKLIEEKKKIK